MPDSVTPILFGKDESGEPQTGIVFEHGSTIQAAVPDANLLNQWTREELRYYAKVLGVRRGQNKKDTIRNLVESGKARVCCTLGYTPSKAKNHGRSTR